MPRILAVALNPAIDISSEADRVQPMLKVRTRNQSQYPGGGGTNVARVIAALGGTPDLAYLSGGATGALYEELLRDQNIRQHRFPMASPVRISLMVREETTGLEYRFIPEGPEVSGEELASIMDYVTSYEGDFLVASGSLPGGAPLDTYARMASSAAARGIRFVLDTSGEALRATLSRSHVFLLKPSLRELESFAGKALDEAGVCATASGIVERGAAEHVVVSMGRQGALLANAEGIVRVPSIRVKEVSAVGAGDSFVGAMTWWLAQGRPMEEAFRFGVAAGAAAVMTPGTELCRREDVFALFKASDPVALQGRSDRPQTAG